MCSKLKFTSHSTQYFFLTVFFGHLGGNCTAPPTAAVRYCVQCLTVLWSLGLPQCRGTANGTMVLQGTVTVPVAWYCGMVPGNCKKSG